MHENIADIARRFGTPFFLYDAQTLESNFAALRAALPESLELFYSLKANPNISIYSFLHARGARAEVSSLAELETVLRVGTDPRDIIYLGPGKSESDLRTLVTKQIYAIVVESLRELALVNEISKSLSVTTDVALRVNPAFGVKGSRLTMGGKPRQFGIDEAQIFGRLDELLASSNLNIIGTHTYMGTRILDEAEIAENTRNIFEMARKFAAASRRPLEMVDIGGGLGVPYFDDERTIDVSKLGALMRPLVEQFQAEFPQTRLIMELGRYLVAESGTFVSKALYVKESMGERFVVTDGGTHCHMAAVGIGGFVKRNFPVVNLSRPVGEIAEYNVTGPLCTPNDVVAKKAKLTAVEEGDLIGILQSGAYGPTASPTLFLSFGFPTELMSYRGEVRVIRERDTIEDMTKKQKWQRFDEVVLKSAARLS